MRKISLTLLYVILIKIIPSQTKVNVHLDSIPQQIPIELNPGFFYNNTNNAANSIYNSSGFYTNCLRSPDVAYAITTGTSQNSILLNIQNNIKPYIQQRAQKTEKMIIQINGIPKWLSPSTNTTLCDGEPNYSIHFPTDVAAWQNLILAISQEIKTWGFTPYYEFWNEPDHSCHWAGSEAQLIHFYKKTAEALKLGDSNCKVGGFGIHNFHKNVASSAAYNSVAGYYPNSLVNQVSVTAHLIDSCALQNIPLDFVSYHFFSGSYQGIKNAQDYFTQKLASAGLPNTKIFVTEHSAPYREYWLENATLIRTYQSFVQNKLAVHALAALQDFVYNPTDEFNGDYGIISRSGCIKPAYVTFRLIDKVRKIGGSLPVHSQGKVIAYSTKSNDTLRLLLSNFLETPLLAAQNKLYYKYNLNTGILSTQGYTSTTMINNTLSGALTPIGSPTLISAFNDAHGDYLFSSSNFNKIDTLKLVFKNQTGSKAGKLIIVDSINNNNVRIYDSLKVQAAYSNSAAINYILNNQSIKTHSISVTDSIYDLVIRKNSVVYIELYNVSITTNTAENEIIDRMCLYPNPTKGAFKIKNEAEIIKSLEIYNNIGNHLRTVTNINQEISLNELANGVYLIKINTLNGSYFKKLIKQP